MSNITTTVLPKILPNVKTESIYLIFDSETWSKKIIQLNILFILGVFSYIFCIFYVIIIKMSKSHIYSHKPELVYEIRTEPTDDETYNCIFLPEARLAYYSNKLSKYSSTLRKSTKKDSNKNSGKVSDIKNCKLVKYEGTSPFETSVEE
uniref:Uncharacterized protein n=2 Tax=Strongyloides papillosus TaxID=174720 RepID=A0A0N5C9J2_STREA